MVNFFGGIVLSVCILLGVQFNSIIADNQLTGKKITEQSITVQLEGWLDQKINSCELQVANDDGKFSHKVKYYDSSNSKIISSTDNYIEYIGGEDKSCSFTIYPNRQPDYFKYGGYGALNRKMRVIASFPVKPTVIDKPHGQLDRPKFDVFYDFYLNYHDTKFNMVQQSVQKITRKAPGTDKTITIYTPTERDTIKKCSLYVKTSLFKSDQLIMTYFDKLVIVKTPGYEYIGDKENSCSIKIHNLDDAQIKFMEKYVYIEVDVIGENHHDLYSYKYEFFMNSLSWWRTNYYSRVFLWPIINIFGVITSVDPQYF